MKRAMVLCGLLFVGGASISLSGMQVTTGPTATSLAATKIERIKDNTPSVNGTFGSPKDNTQIPSLGSWQRTRQDSEIGPSTVHI